MKKIHKTQILSILQRLGLDKTSIEYLMEAIDICYKKKIHFTDICMKSFIYPRLELKFSHTQCSIENYIRKEINRIWKDSNHDEIKEILGYEHKPTTKRLIEILLVRVIDK